MDKKRGVCKYTKEGRENVHENLKIDVNILRMLAKAVSVNKSIEYMDNRVSLYAAQYGKCAITGRQLWIDEIHCHHKIPLSLGGNDHYENLIIIHPDVHRLIHAANVKTIQHYRKILCLDRTQVAKVNKLREKAELLAI
jgi:5-methylcytosine-specific restriction endonuclease McrA